MNKTIKGLMAGIFLGVLGMVTFTQLHVSGQSQGPNEERLIGSWDIRVTIRDCGSGAELGSFPSMMTFNQGGTMQETANDATPLKRLPGHGVWRHSKGQSYTRAFHFFRFNPDGTFAGTGRISGSLEVGPGGDTVSGTSSFEFFDVDGNTVVSGCATEAGTRFQ